VSDSEKKRLADAAADDRAPAFPGDCADTFDALPKAAPGEYGSWAGCKAKGPGDVTPEEFAEMAASLARRIPWARASRFAHVLTADGVATVDLDGLEAEFAQAIEEMKR